MSGELVGLSNGNCKFTPVGENSHGSTFPDLPALETAIEANNNKDVDGMRDNTGAPRDYRQVVFFAPLTRPKDFAGRFVPANALWQLKGAIATRKRLNDLANNNPERVPLKLRLANIGDLFKDGADVAPVIADQPAKGPGSVAAVIGISQSRRESLEAFTKMSDIPVIGASIFGGMANGADNFFMVGPADARFTEKMALWVHDHAPGYVGAEIVYDPDDQYFSDNLREDLTVDLTRAGVTHRLENDITLTEKVAQNKMTPSARRRNCAKTPRRACCRCSPVTPTNSR